MMRREDGHVSERIFCTG